MGHTGSSAQRRRIRHTTGMKQHTTPRGIRNHNPGNLIRHAATRWQGMAADQSGDHRFVIFESPELGLRALLKVLINYHELHDIHTVTGVVSRWAPDSENDTAAYITHVANRLGVAPDAAIDLTDHDTVLSVARAIVRHENGPGPLAGEWYDEATWHAAARLAGLTPPPKPIHHSRTLQGATVVAATGTLAAAADAAQQFSSLIPILDRLANLPGWLLALCAVAAAGYIAWARLDDRQRYHH